MFVPADNNDNSNVNLRNISHIHCLLVLNYFFFNLKKKKIKKSDYFSVIPQMVMTHKRM